MRFPLPPIADQAVLFLWRLASMPTDALAVAEAWGFRVVSEVVWQKLTKHGRPWFGMGRTVRASHQTALVCLRGPASALIRSRSIRSTFSAPVPTYALGHPAVGRPLLDELGRPLLDRRGRVRAIRVGDYIHSAKPEAFFTEELEPVAERRSLGGRQQEQLAAGELARARLGPVGARTCDELGRPAVAGMR